MSPEDVALAEKMATLNDAQLSDLLAQIDAAQIVASTRQIVMLDAALWYATALDWPVFPLVPGRKSPLTAHGFKDATTDTEVITSWWTRWPESNIGVPTGHRDAGGCGYDVIDVDGLVGFKSLRELQHRDCPPDCCAVSFCPATGALPAVEALAFTPGDPKGIANGRVRGQGRHLYVPAAGTVNTTQAFPGIDLRGNGGYVVVSPSVGPSGGRYTWIKRPVAA
ncbi:MAG: bifunctional DNA primase/polymerase [Actinomycetes bacterium]